MAADSENSYIFVKVENGISALEAAKVDNGYQPIADQITTNGWTALDGVTGVYYKVYTNGQQEKDMKVFNDFTIADDASTRDAWNNVGSDTKVTVTAYAVQKEGFDTAKAAWEAAKFN